MPTRQKLRDYKILDPRTKQIMLMLEAARRLIMIDIDPSRWVTKGIEFKSAKHDTRKREIRIYYEVIKDGTT